VAPFHSTIFTQNFVKFNQLIENAMEENDTGTQAESWCIRKPFFSFSWNQSVLKIGFKYFTLKKKL
jgi:hypothetical protein